MLIRNVEAIYPNYPSALGAWRKHLWQIVVRIETDVGVTGFGYGGGGKASLPIINGHFRELLVGQSIDSIEQIDAIWDLLYSASIPYGRKGIAVMALSGIDLALWDLLGQAEKVPVYQLLGGLKKERVRGYASGIDPEWYAEMGFTAHKMVHRWTGNPADYDNAIASAERARAVFPKMSGADDNLLMFDCYMSWDADVTVEMSQRLAPFDIYWFEDVTTPDELEAQSTLRKSIKPIRLAGGEHEFTQHGFTDIARTEALDIWQPDITWCGGITATLRILKLAHEAGKQVVLHRGGEVWGLHFIAATDCDNLGEVLPGKRDEESIPLWIDEPQVQHGYLTPADAPGFGVKINEELL